MTLLKYALNIYYQNARGINVKLNDFRVSLCTGDYDVIVITETWLNICVNNSEFSNNNYSIYGYDRNFEKWYVFKGAEVIIAVNNVYQ